MQSKISIITVVYNDIIHIKQTMDSITKQSYPYIEYILIDGASNDGTKEIIESYIKNISNILKEECIEQSNAKAKLESRFYLEAIKKDNQNFSFKFLSQKDSGIYDAMNKGIDLATGEWCNFMNCGDNFYNEFVIENLFRAYKNLKEGGAISIIYGDAKIFFDDDNYKILHSKTTKHKYRHHFIHQAAFIKTNLMKSYKYDTSFKIAGDTDFFTRAYNNGVIFKHFKEIIVSFNVEGISSNLSFRMFKEDCIIGFKYNRFFPILHISKYIFWIIPRVCIRNIIPKKFRNKARVVFGKKNN
ncbi:glycosyltransferase family 2 protein [Helicobacter sp. MIT 14-3879]|uniref:glycosyltransferase family 2 protein n=1 Tax=Helicobacter sp. MIT 14-3879 TaxID=2040649 RepID=UPI000E1F05FD|nr:glycosyltransferase family 2 protein [Helicobacter sp. MIT 14-3879]RDU63999.1 glycosyltransferase [Helicobacter sp. MIT 14-3879]